MPFKINISHKGKTLKKEIDSESLIGRKIGETIPGNLIAAELSGYELEITGTSDKAGFPGKKDVEGAELRRVLLTKGFGMKRKPKGLKKKTKKAVKGLRLKKTVRGNTISPDTIQVNTIVKKEGEKKFESLAPKKEKAEETTKTEPANPETTKPHIEAQTKAETTETKKKEVTEEKPAEQKTAEQPETPAQ